MGAGENPTTGRVYPLMTVREIEALIAEGKAILIKDQHVLKVDAWMKFHPGGDKAIQHMVGRDATDEVNALVLPIILFKHFLTDPTPHQPSLA